MLSRVFSRKQSCSWIPKMPHNKKELQWGGSEAVLWSPSKAVRLTVKVWGLPATSLQCSSTGGAKKSVHVCTTWISWQFFLLGLFSTGELADHYSVSHCIICIHKNSQYCSWSHCQDFFSFCTNTAYSFVVFSPGHQLCSLSITRVGCSSLTAMNLNPYFKYSSSQFWFFLDQLPDRCD